MKKTIIALVALTGVAMAETITLSPLTTTLQLGASNPRKTANATQNVDAGTLTITDTDWSRAYGIYDLGEKAITMGKKDTLSFSYTIQSSAPTGNGEHGGNSWGSTLTATLIGDGIALTTGSGNYNSDISMGTSDPTGMYFFQMKDASSGSTQKVVNNVKSANGVFTADTALTLTTTIEWSEQQGEYMATVTYGDNSTLLGSVTLGEEFKLKQIAFNLDAGSMTDPHNIVNTISNASLTYTAVPEPATATLSLLALAGLATRRRRK